MFILEVKRNSQYDFDDTHGFEIFSLEEIDDVLEECFEDNFETVTDSYEPEFQPGDCKITYTKTDKKEKFNIQGENVINIDLTTRFDRYKLPANFSDCTISFNGETKTVEPIAIHFQEKFLGDILKKFDDIKSLDELYELFKERYVEEFKLSKQEQFAHNYVTVSLGQSIYKLNKAEDYDIKDIIKSVFLEKHITDYQYEHLGNLETMDGEEFFSAYLENDYSDDIDDFGGFENNFYIPDYEVRSRVNADDPTNIISTFYLEKNDIYLADKSFVFTMEIQDVVISNSRNYNIDINLKKMNGEKISNHLTLSDTNGYKLLEYISNNLGDWAKDPELIDAIIPYINNYIDDLRGIQK
jgi:hypothetical protein